MANFHMSAAIVYEKEINLRLSKRAYDWILHFYAKCITTIVRLELCCDIKLYSLGIVVTAAGC